MSLEVLSSHIGQIEEDTLKGVPEHLLWDIWQHASTRHRTAAPFQAWRTFASILRGSSDKIHLGDWKYNCELSEPTAPLPIYIVPLKSPTSDFIVHLTIASGVSFPAADLFVLPTMPNLCVLEVLQPQDSQQAILFPRVNDSIVREWSQCTNPFPSLRALRIWGEDFTTFRSLAYVTRFPALRIFDVTGLRTDWRKRDAQHPAWIRSDIEQLVEDELNRASTPFATIILGHVDRHVRDSIHSHSCGNLTTYAAADDEVHFSFIRCRQSQQAAATLPQKRATGNDGPPRRLKRNKLHDVDDLLSQFRTG